MSPGAGGRRSCLLAAALLAAGAALASPAAARAEEPVVRAVMCSSVFCPHCRVVREQTLPPLAALYGPRLKVLVLDTTTPLGRDLCGAAYDRFGIVRRAVPMLILGDTVLMGSDDIPRRLPGLIEESLARGGAPWPDIPGLAEALGSEVSLAGPAAPPTAPPLIARAEPPPPPAPPQAVAASPAVASAAAGRQETAPPAAEARGQGGRLPAAGPSVPPLPAPDAAPETAPAAPAAQPPAATSGPSIVELGGAGSAGPLQLFARDPVGNGLAVVVLVGMVAAVAVAAFRFRRLRPLAGRARLLVPLLALVGLGVAAYLAHVEVSEVEAVCGPVGDCHAVQQSEYARLFGLLPIGVLGVLGYLAILAAWALHLRARPRLSALAGQALAAMGAFGVLFSAYLTFLEPFVIGATCMWCLSSAVVMTALFLLTLPLARPRPEPREENS